MKYAQRLVLGLSAIIASCASNSDEDVAQLSGGVIYGDDDREELVQSSFRGLESNAVALIPRGNLEKLLSDNTREWNAFGHSLKFCAGQRFAEQPRAAVCGAVAIAQQYVLTASHCLPDQAACDQLAFVRNYAVDGTGRLAPDELDTYECRELVLSVRSEPLDGASFDFAIARLSRSIPDLGPMATGVPIGGHVGVCVGPSGGQPFKVSAAKILDVEESNGFFYAAVDLFAGGSGSGIFDEEANLIGIAVSGAQDYVETPAGCLEPNIIGAESGGSGELANDIGAILRYACSHDTALPFCAARGASVDANTAHSSKRGTGCQLAWGRATEKGPDYAILLIAITTLLLARRAVAGKPVIGIASGIGSKRVRRDLVISARLLRCSHFRLALLGLRVMHRG